MDQEKQLTGTESLSIIQQMIDTAKKEQRDDGKGWIIWGWMLLAASVLTVLNLHFRWDERRFIFWNGIGIITVIYFIWKMINHFFIKRRTRVKTYTGDLLAKLNTGFFIGLMFIIIIINVGARRVTEGMVFVNIGYALLINLYSFWILIYGTALHFKPSVIGAYVSWAISFAALFANDFETVMLLHAAAVLAGYIIPGHIANRKFKKIHSSRK